MPQIELSQRKPLLCGVACASDLENYIRQRTEPVYLTNGCCESAHGTAELFDVLGLSSGEFQGEFYPLTRAEEQFIAEYGWQIGKHGLLSFGYSALYQGRKWYYPSIEFSWDADHIPDASEQDAAANLEALKAFARLAPMLEAIGGKAIFSEYEGFDRHQVSLLIPMDWVRMRFQNFYDYKTWVVSICE